MTLFAPFVRLHSYIHRTLMETAMNEVTKPAKDQARKSKIESYDISRSDETLHLATDLAKFIKTITMKDGYITG